MRGDVALRGLRRKPAGATLGLAVEANVPGSRAAVLTRIAESGALLLALLVATTIVACGGGGGSAGATASTQQPYPVARGLDFTIIPMVNNGTTVAFEWSGSGASSYQLEIGSSSGASDVAVLDAAGATTYTWTSVPVGVFYARVRGRQATTLGAASNEVIVGSVDPRQMIDALIFGAGPLAVAGYPAGPLVGDRMEGWQPGAAFAVTLGQSVPTETATSVDKTVAQLGPATMGALSASVASRGPDPLPSPGPGEVTVSVLGPDDLKDQCICTGCVGCAWHWVRGSFIQRGRILISTSAQPSAVAHELGHVIGLAHIISAAGVRPPFTMGFTTDGQYSPNGQLNVLEPATIRMLEMLYGAGLTAGSTRGQFQAAGFVLPEAAGAAPPLQADRRRGYVVREEGDETLVIKPLCPQAPW
jgi:hypothetical protein